MTPDPFIKNIMTTKPPFISKPFDGDEGGPPANPKPVEFTPDQQKQIDAMITQATEGLKNTNKALKDEKTTLKSEFDTLMQSLGGKEGLDALTAMRKRLETDELGKMLATGKHEEWFEAKVGPLKASYEQAITERDGKVAEAENKAKAAVARMQDTILQVDVANAAVAAKVQTEPGVLRDITRAAREVFKWSDEHEALVREKDGVVVFGKDGKTPQTIAEWLPTQQEDSRHWWGPSAGGGLKGSKNLLNGQNNPWSKQGWNLTKQGEFMREHGRERADQLAASVGSKVGATSPPA
jgi:hypothetical protein